MALVALKKECSFTLHVEFSILVMFLIISHCVLVATFIRKPSLPLASILSGGPPSFSQNSLSNRKEQTCRFSFCGRVGIKKRWKRHSHRNFRYLFAYICKFDLFYLLTHRFVALWFHNRWFTFDVLWTTQLPTE